MRFAVLVALLSCALQANGATYFVAMIGNDSISPGSIALPFLTIQKAIGVVVAGDTIYVREGTYHNSTTIRPNRSGSQGRPINLWAYPGENPTVDFSLQPYSSSSRGFYFSSSYWYLKGFVVRFAGDNGIYITGAHNIVENCSIYGNKDSGLQISGGGSYNIVINCDAYWNYDPLTHGQNADGIDAKLSIGPGNEFHGCRCYDNSDDGYDLYEGQYPVLIDSCWAFHNGYNLWGDAAFTGNGNGFKVGGNYIPASHRVTHSVAFDNRVKGFDQNHNTAGITLYNNTSFRNGGANFSFPSIPTTGRDTLINNVSFQGTTSLEGSAMQATNSWQGHTVSGSDFLSTDTSLARAARAPGGALPITDFLRLAAGSSLIDTGTNVGLPFSGSAPDLGAFETTTGVMFYPITATAGSHGTITPAGTVPAAAGDSLHFTMAPDAGYHIADVLVDGMSVGAVGAYTFYNVTATHTINAGFAVNSYTITAIAGPNGSVVPSGAVSVVFNHDTAFTIIPDTGFRVDSVLVDGSNVDSTTRYTFTHVIANHGLTAAFAPNLYTLTVNAFHGSVTKNPDQPSYAYRTTVQLTASPSAGFDSVNWFGDVPAGHERDNPLTLSMDTSRILTAYFGSAATQYALAGGWNLLSLPRIVSDSRKGIVFPDAVSNAFRYNGSYAVEDTLAKGSGYWLKFSAAETLAVDGTDLLFDTIGVSRGWNIIGSLSVPVSVSDIRSIPPGIVTSPFIRYSGTYGVADTIRPGQGYWVKVNQTGSFLLSAFSMDPAAPGSARIRIVPTTDRPPDPPSAMGSPGEPLLPNKDVLGQNYPNPFNPATIIRYRLAAPAHVSLNIYDTRGNEVAKLVDAVQSAGFKSVVWNAAGVPSGTYFYRLKAGRFLQARKLIVVK